MTGWLASITDINEAQLALAADADVIDAKNPHMGALGALPHGMVRHIVNTIKGQTLVSATIGDIPEMKPSKVTHAVSCMADTGVDYVKVGLFHSPMLMDCLDALGPFCQNIRLIAVLFADCYPDIHLIDRIKQLGFSGVMLDTMHKSSGGLLQHLSLSYIAEFVGLARHSNLICGLAGSLKTDDILTLSRLNPDYLGFRGALCDGSLRTNGVSFDAMRSINQILKLHQSTCQRHGTVTNLAM